MTGTPEAETRDEEKDTVPGNRKEGVSRCVSRGWRSTRVLT